MSNLLRHLHAKHRAGNNCRYRSLPSGASSGRWFWNAVNYFPHDAKAKIAGHSRCPSGIWRGPMGAMKGTVDLDRAKPTGILFQMDPFARKISTRAARNTLSGTADLQSRRGSTVYQDQSKASNRYSALLCKQFSHAPPRQHDQNSCQPSLYLHATVSSDMPGLKARHRVAKCNVSAERPFRLVALVLEAKGLSQDGPLS